MNAINVIWPHKHHGMWVFDDARVGLVQEPFVSKHRDGLGGPCNGCLPHGMGISRLTDLPTGMGPGSTRCLAFRRTDPTFEPSLRQHRSPLSGNAILRCRDKGAETAPQIHSTECRDKMRAGIPASSGLFALNREISGCARLRGGAGRTRTSNQTIISRQL